MVIANEKSQSIKTGSGPRKDEDDVRVDTKRGGLGRSWMFNDIRVFTVLLFFVVVFYTAVYSFNVGLLVTLERRFSLTAKQQGFLYSSIGIATMCTIPFVSYFLGKPSSHRPRWLGMAVIVLGTAFCVSSLPHFLSAPYQYDKAGNYSRRTSSGTGLCDDGPSAGGGSDACGSEQDAASVDNEMAYAIFLLCNICSGICVGFITTLAFSYIDDFSGDRSSIYLGLIDGAWGIGLPLGFGAMSAVFLAIYVDFDRVDMADINIDDSDPRWIGAWWVVGAAGGPTLMLLSMPLFFFPKSLPLDNMVGDTTDRETEERPKENTVYSKGKMILHHVKDILLTTRTLLRNPVYMLVTFGYAINQPVAFALFMPKYFQKDLGFTLAMSNLIVGFLWLFPNFPTAVVIGWLIKKFKLTKIGLVKLMIGLIICIIVTNSLVIGLPCEGPYFEGSRSGETMVVDCNSGCDCELDHYQPVCGSNGLNYYSPCYAGCSTFISDTNFTECLCINPDNPVNTFAQDGLCPIPTCKYYSAFLLILTVFAVCNSGMSLPVTMVTVRCVDQKQKSYALGLKQVMTSVFQIPAVIVAGALIDHTCLLWREDCGERGACAQYDNTLYRVVILSICAGLSVIALILFVVALIILTRRERHQEETDGHSYGELNGDSNSSFELKNIMIHAMDNDGFITK